MTAVIWTLFALAIVSAMVAVVVHLRTPRVVPKKRTFLAILACLGCLVAYVMVCDWFKWKPGADGSALRYIVMACCLTAIFKGVRG